MTSRIWFRALGIPFFVALGALLAPAVRADEEGWGIRFGFADDPDQFVVGGQYDVGEVIPHLHIVPVFELGFGDDHTVLSLAGFAHYHFKGTEKLEPYAGGGVEAGWIDHDHDGQGQGNDDDDEDFEIQLDLVGGLRFPMKSGNEFFVELIIGTGDLHDAQIMGGFRF